MREGVREQGQNAAYWLAASSLVAFFVLGGGTRQGLPVEALLQGLGMLLLAAAFVRGPWSASPQPARRMLLLAAGIAVLIGIQMLPLPRGLWAELSGRSALAEDLAVAGVNAGSFPISVDVDATLRALLALLPPVGMFAFLITLPADQRRSLLRLLLWLVAGSAVFGFMQIADGQDSALRWHEHTNIGAAVGPFANRNHLGSALVLAIPLAAASMLAVLQGKRTEKFPLHIAAHLGLMALLMLGLVISESRAGAGLAVVSIAATITLAIRSGRALLDAMVQSRRWLAALMLLVVVGSALLGLFGFLNQLDKDPRVDMRWSVARNTLAAAQHYGPLGSGAGTFPTVYTAHVPASERENLFVNRAHNDWFEWRLEGGWPLMALVAIGVLMLARLTKRAWQSAVTDLEVIWACAASIGLWTLLLHSLVDYPLRTTSLACTAAVLLACLILDSPDSPERRDLARP